ncbi:M55 family metallopeptidase [Rhizobium lusitanum]|uniref:D-amino peptidase n=1 Tax=Rhizobium lusitanum TaxID=293958 RepID=A0A7X0ISG6_9HYPH|nr:M55 family metallopeptidase [Rhizobium lusitanum]MBB6486185.1 D-amino peptidase [Rhizobium lusitanum]
MRLYISADIEGIVGVVSRDHLMPEGFEYENARRWMTDTVVNACEAAHEEGVEEIILSDSHGNGESILIDRLPDYVQIVRSWPRPLMMMQGVELGSFVGAMLLGYHAGASHLGGVLSHTIGGTAFAEVRINGIIMPEAGINAAIAGHFDVPILLASGDNVALAEITERIGDIVTVPVKTVYSTQSAITLTPNVAHRRIREGVKTALARASSARPFKIEEPILEIVFRNRLPAEYLSYLKGVERIDGYTIRYLGDDMIDVSRFIQFVVGYNSRLTF